MWKLFNRLHKVDKTILCDHSNKASEQYSHVVLPMVLYHFSTIQIKITDHHFHMVRLNKLWGSNKKRVTEKPLE